MRLLAVMHLIYLAVCAFTRSQSAAVTKTVTELLTCNASLTFHL